MPQFSINPPNPDEVHPTSFTPGPNLAPNPFASPGPQNDGFSGIRSFGDNGTEHAVTAEFLGAQQMITAGLQAPQEDHSFDWPQGSPGGKVLPPATPRTQG